MIRAFRSLPLAAQIILLAAAYFGGLFDGLLTCVVGGGDGLHSLASLLGGRGGYVGYYGHDNWYNLGFIIAHLEIPGAFVAGPYLWVYHWSHRRNP
jgi:hypothetical protein